MPWTKRDVADHIKGLDERAQSVWVQVANGRLKIGEAAGERDAVAASAQQASAVAGRIGEAVRVAETYLIDAFVANNLTPPIRLKEAGRKLSGKNEGRVRAAIDQLSQMLSELEQAYADEEKTEGADEARAEAAALRASFQLLAEVAMSHDERRMMLHKALNTTPAPGEEPPYRTPVRIGDGRLVFHEDGPFGGRLMECFYEIEEGAVKLSAASPVSEDSAGCAQCIGDCPCKKLTGASEADSEDCECDQDGPCEECEDECTDCTEGDCEYCTGECQCASESEESKTYVVWPHGRGGAARVIAEQSPADHADFDGQHSHEHMHDGESHSHIHAHDDNADHQDHEHNADERAALAEATRPQVWSWAEESFGWRVLAETDNDPNVGGGTDRDKLKASDFAWPETKSYPIVTKGDVSDAASSIGRLKAGKATDEERATLKANITRIAKRKGFADALPDDWNAGGKPASGSESSDDSEESNRIPAPYSVEDLIALREAGATDIESDAVRLAEAAVRKDGTAQVKIITPGWGSSGYYSEAMLSRDGPKVFRRGTPMFVNHPTQDEESARPERDITQLAGVLTKDAIYRGNGPMGPGLYGEARIYPHWRDFVEAVAPDTGVSIRALGKGVDGEVDGRRGKIIESLVAGKSVDFVTAPGAGGHVLQLFESARSGVPSAAPAQGRKPVTNSSDISPARAREILQANETMQDEIRDLRNELARQRERAMFREAKDMVTTELGKAENLPPATRVRIAERVVPQAKPGVDGELDMDDLMERVHVEVKAEVAYLSSIRGLGSIRNMGSSFGMAESGHMGFGDEITDARTKDLEKTFASLGLSEAAAARAARGRD